MQTVSMEYCVFVEPQQGASYVELRDFAVAAERLGFHGFFRSDHYLAMSGDGLPGPSDAWTTLAALAVETSTIRLGTLVSSVTYRHPGILAIQVANVDQISGGRAELGLGAGWFEAEHTAYGIPFPAKRFDLLEEQLQIVSGLWELADEETFDFAGRHYTLAGAPARQRPVQEQLPIIVGGSGPVRTPQLAARYASEFNSFRGPVTAAERFDVVRSVCEQEGRDPATLRFSAAIPVLVGTDQAELERRANRIGTTVERHRDNPDTATGSPAEVADLVARYAESGASRVYLQLMDSSDLGQLEQLAGALL